MHGQQNIIIPWVLHVKRIVLQLLNKILVPVFYGSQSFITFLTKTATCAYPEPDGSNPYPPICHLVPTRPTSPDGLFSSGPPTKTLYTFFAPHV